MVGAHLLKNATKTHEIYLVFNKCHLNDSFLSKMPTNNTTVCLGELCYLRQVGYHPTHIDPYITVLWNGFTP